MNEQNGRNQNNVITRESIGAVGALFSLLAFLILMTRSLIFGEIGASIDSFLLGVFGYSAYVFVPLVFFSSVSAFLNKKFIKKKAFFVFFLFTVCFVLSLMQAIKTYSWSLDGFFSACYQSANDGVSSVVPFGWIGGVIVGLLFKFVGKAGTFVILSLCLLVFALLTLRSLRGRSVFGSLFAKKSDKQVNRADEKQSVPDSQKEIAAQREESVAPQDVPSYVQKDSDAEQAYKNSRDILFGGTPAENYKRNLIFDDTARVNNRQTPSIEQVEQHGGFGDSYQSAYTDAVNSGADTHEKIYTDNTAKGRDYYPTHGAWARIEEQNTYSQPSQPVQPVVQPTRPETPVQPIQPSHPFESQFSHSDSFPQTFSQPSDTPSPAFGGRTVENSDNGLSDETREQNFNFLTRGFRSETQEPKVSQENDFSENNLRRGGFDETDSLRSSRSVGTETFAKADDSTVDSPVSRRDIFDLNGDDELPSLSERSDRTDRVDRTERTDFSGRSDEENRTEHGEPDDFETFGRRDRTDRIDRTERVDRAERVDRTERSDRDERAEIESVRETKPVEPPAPPAPPKPRVIRPYSTAPLTYFDCSEVIPDSNAQETEQTKATIIETLEAFKVSDATIASVTYGPTVTRYNVAIPRNISAKKVVALDQEIAMNLYAGNGVNIYPNYDMGAVSIEVPNKRRQFVSLGCMLADEEFMNAKPNSLTFALGKDVGNKKVYGDVRKMVHILVAGTSGSGKSVFLHSMIVSLISRYSPADLRLILIDPKKTEFVIYDHLPHLVINEIISDTNKAIQSLTWAIGEMNRRYELFEKKSRAGTYVVNIDEYNDKLEEGETKLPKIVIIIDELADLMLAAQKDMESRIQNLTQKSRAAGIHMILTTQRPSTDVITGVIKSNLQTRIALTVASEIDSRVILDASGAQKLLGKGDMLYVKEGTSTPTRVQSPSITSEQEQKIVNYIRDNNDSYYDEGATAFINNLREGGADTGGEAEEGNVEAVYIQALKFIIQTGSASISMIQRKCGVGYNKAGKIIEWMEDMGYISSFDGMRSRKVLITEDEFREKYGDL